MCRDLCDMLWDSRLVGLDNGYAISSCSGVKLWVYGIWACRFTVMTVGDCGGIAPTPYILWEQLPPLLPRFCRLWYYPGLCNGRENRMGHLYCFYWQVIESSKYFLSSFAIETQINGWSWHDNSWWTFSMIISIHVLFTHCFVTHVTAFYLEMWAWTLLSL